MLNLISVPARNNIQFLSVMLQQVLLFARYILESTHNKMFIYYFTYGMCIGVIFAGVH